MAAAAAKDEQMAAVRIKPQNLLHLERQAVEAIIRSADDPSAQQRRPRAAEGAWRCAQPPAMPASPPEA